MPEIIKQISVYDGSSWGTKDIGVNAGNVLLSSSIAGSTDLQTALGNILPENQLTANQVLIAGSDKKITTSGVSATQLGYLDGVTSNIQTQLDEKLPLMNTYSQDGTGFNKNFLLITPNNFNTQHMRRSGWSWFGTTERANFTNIPTLLANATSAAGIRQVYFINSNQIQVRVIENYPQFGRVHANAYQNGTWTGWRTINANYSYQPIGIAYQNGTVTIPAGISGKTSTQIAFNSGLIPSGGVIWGAICCLSGYQLPYLNANNNNVVTWIESVRNECITIANLTSAWTNYAYYMTVFYFKS